MNRVTLHHKINGVYDFKLADVRGISTALKLTPEEIIEVFDIKI